MGEGVGAVGQRGYVISAPKLRQEMNGDDPANWEKSNWSNNNPFNNTWQPDNVSFSDGIMTLTLDNKGCPSACRDKPYASGEYRTSSETYSYGYYEARLKAAAGDGLVTGFFSYTGTWGKPSHDEVDFEILGKNCRQVQTNFYASGSKGNEQIISLSFNACEEFHNYAFKIAPDELVFYIDGQVVRTVKASEEALPSKPSKIMVNLWPGTGVDGWLKPFRYSGQPITAQYDWIRYAPLGQQEQAPGVLPAEPRPAEPEAILPEVIPEPIPILPEVVVPAAPPTFQPNSGQNGKVLNLYQIYQNDYSFNGGRLSVGGNTFHFSANKKQDPGFGIITRAENLTRYAALSFEIKGNVINHGQQAKLAVQVFADASEGAQPVLTQEPLIPSEDYQTIRLELRGRVSKVQKIQFVLATDNGSCDVFVKNIRFE